MASNTKNTELALVLRSFFLDYLPKLKGNSRHTISSYRDSLKLLLIFLASARGKVEDITFETISPEKVIAFLNYLEKERHNTIGSRNNRLAAFHCFFRYVAGVFPHHICLAQQILNIPFKRSPTREIDYLTFEEIKSVLNEADLHTVRGRRDHVLLVLMFNTGGRVQEIVDLKASDLNLVAPYSVRFFGKGRKERTCPIWSSTARELSQYLDEREVDPRSPSPVFTNRNATPLTRFGVRYILGKYVRVAAIKYPQLGKKRLHPHSMRHSTAIHLLKAGVDLTSIANWLGHASPNTTNRYATIDLEMKRKALEKAKPVETKSPEWHRDKDLLKWLESL